jgi:hypothetical protein
MTLEAAFQVLHQRLESFKEAVDELQLNVSGDYLPENPLQKRTDGNSICEKAPLPVERLADKVSELEGPIEEAQHAAATAARAARHPQNLAETQMALITVQRCLNSVLKTFLDDVAAYDTVHTLIQMGRRKGGKWPESMALIKTVIDACRPPFYGALQAHSECWEELTEKLRGKPVAIRVTNSDSG